MCLSLKFLISSFDPAAVKLRVQPEVDLHGKLQLNEEISVTKRFYLFVASDLTSYIIMTAISILGITSVPGA
jgi:hypothetical protein